MVRGPAAATDRPDAHGHTARSEDQARSGSFTTRVDGFHGAIEETSYEVLQLLDDPRES